jgi:hypothetical protein
MCNIVLSDDLSIRSYFEKVLNLSKLGDKFPVNLDDVWPLVYSAKEKAVRALVSSDQFMQGIDYEILATNGEKYNSRKTCKCLYDFYILYGVFYS